MRPIKLIFYTDGSCLGNPGKGGWAWAQPVSVDPREASAGASGHSPETTNNEMELMAIFKAIESTKDYGTAKKAGEAFPISLVIRTDSQYAINCLTTWSKKWQYNGWKNIKGDPVKNAKLIKETLDLIEEAASRSTTVAFEHIRGHNGDYWNEWVDTLARRAATNYGS